MTRKNPWGARRSQANPLPPGMEFGWVVVGALCLRPPRDGLPSASAGRGPPGPPRPAPPPSAYPWSLASPSRGGDTAWRPEAPVQLGPICFHRRVTRRLCATSYVGFRKCLGFCCTDSSAWRRRLVRCSGVSLITAIPRRPRRPRTWFCSPVRRRGGAGPARPGAPRGGASLPQGGQPSPFNPRPHGSPFG